MRSGRIVRRWQDELGPFPPYRLDADALFVSYILSAEFGFHIALGWGQPACALDPYVEFRHYVNDGDDQERRSRKGLLQPRRRAALFLRGRNRHRAQDRHARSDPARPAVHRRGARRHLGLLRGRRSRTGASVHAHRPDHPLATARHVAREIHVGRWRSRSGAAFRSIYHF